MIKREDLIHEHISGNKWRKLKGYIEKIQTGKHRGIITFGGAFSNHIHATAAAGRHFNIPTVGIIRGEYDDHNPTLRFAANQGMDLRFVTRSAYREKQQHEDIQKIVGEHPDHLIVPEGGSGLLSLVGLQELAQEIQSLPDPDIVTVAAGTGMTASGLVKYQDRLVTVISALKSIHLKAEIEKVTSKSFDFCLDYHFGGYAKVTVELVQFINEFRENTNIPLDPIYNGKAIYGVMNMVNKGLIKSGSTVLHIHTGGLQGIAAYNYMAMKQGKQLITKP